MSHEVVEVGALQPHHLEMAVTEVPHAHMGCDAVEDAVGAQDGELAAPAQVDRAVIIDHRHFQLPGRRIDGGR